MDPRARLDPDAQPDVSGQLGALAFKAGYAERLLQEQRERSSDAAGDRIVEAAQRIAGSNFWGDDGDSWTDADTFGTEGELRP